MIQKIALITILAIVLIALIVYGIVLIENIKKDINNFDEIEFNKRRK